MTDNESDFYEGYIVCPACGYREAVMMKASIDIDGNDVVIWLNYNGKVIHTAYEIALDELGYLRESGEFDNFVEAQLESGVITDEQAEALTEMESAIAEAVYRSLEAV